MQDQGLPKDEVLLVQGAADVQAAANSQQDVGPTSPRVTAKQSPEVEHAPPSPSGTPDSASGSTAEPRTLTEADFGTPPRSFAEMDLADDIRTALTEMGFSEPMPVQKRVFRPIVAGTDLIVQSRTGSGKTAAFGIPFVQSVLRLDADVKNGYPQVLVLGPTRELALQVANEIGRIAARRALSIAAVYGGAPMGRQVEALKAGVHLLSGTPGRVLDHLRRGTLHLSRLRAVVLDEADEMLSMGFLEDISEILRRCPTERQTLLFSATIPDDVLRLQHRYLRSPLHIQLSGDSISAAEIVHAYYMVTGMGRMRDLLRVIEIERPESAIIFCNTREETSAVAEFLRNQGHDAEPISSDLSQSERERVMKRMKAKDLKFLVATDVAARGIDISDLPFVINYTFPETAEVYVHRTGRTGRAGKRGVAVSLISPRELGNFYYLKLTYKIRPEERALPTENELRTLREGQYVDRLGKELAHLHPEPEFRSLLRRLLASDSGETILSLLLQQHLRSHEPARASHAHDTSSHRASRPNHRAERPSDDHRPRSDARPHRDRTEPAHRETEKPTELSPKESPVRVQTGGTPVAQGSVTPPQPSSVVSENKPSNAPHAHSLDEERRAKEPRTREDRQDRPRDDRPRDDRPRDDRPRDDRPRDDRPRDDRPRERRAPRAESQNPGPRADHPPSNVPSGVIHAEDGREFWEAWADERAKNVPAKTHAAAPPTRAAQSVLTPAYPSAPVPPPEASQPAPQTRRPRRDTRPPQAGEVRLYLSIGRRDNIDEDGLRSFLTAQGIGDLPLELHSSHAYLFAPEAQVEPVIFALSGKSLGTRAIACERARR